MSCGLPFASVNTCSFALVFQLAVCAQVPWQQSSIVWFELAQPFSSFCLNESCQTVQYVGVSVPSLHVLSSLFRGVNSWEFASALRYTLTCSPIRLVFVS